MNICFIRCSVLQDYVDNYDEHSFFHRDYRDILCWGIGLNESLYYKKTKEKIAFGNRPKLIIQINSQDWLKQLYFSCFKLLNNWNVDFYSPIWVAVASQIIDRGTGFDTASDYFVI